MRGAVSMALAYNQVKNQTLSFSFHLSGACLNSRASWQKEYLVMTYELHISHAVHPIRPY